VLFISVLLHTVIRRETSEQSRHKGRECRNTAIVCQEYLGGKGIVHAHHGISNPTKSDEDPGCCDEGWRPTGVKGFQRLPWRWIVEQTFGWLGRYRRLSKDDEYLPQTSKAMIRVAMIHLMVRHLARLTCF
jgi:hypothetical protein